LPSGIVRETLSKS